MLSNGIDSSALSTLISKSGSFEEAGYFWYTRWSSGLGGVWVPGAVSGVLVPLGSILHVQQSIPHVVACFLHDRAHLTASGTPPCGDGSAIQPILLACHFSRLDHRFNCPLFFWLYSVFMPSQFSHLSPQSSVPSPQSSVLSPPFSKNG